MERNERIAVMVVIILTALVVFQFTLIFIADNGSSSSNDYYTDDFDSDYCYQSVISYSCSDHSDSGNFTFDYPFEAISCRASFGYTDTPIYGHITIYSQNSLVINGTVLPFMEFYFDNTDLEEGDYCKQGEMRPVYNGEFDPLGNYTYTIEVTGGPVQISIEKVLGTVHRHLT